MGPIDDAVRVLEELKSICPQMNQPPFFFGKLEITFKDGGVFSIGPYPYLLRGKDFSASPKKTD